jgi:hypothetical protein
MSGKFGVRHFINTPELDNGTDGPKHVGDKTSWVISTSEHKRVCFEFND